MLLTPDQKNSALMQVLDTSWGRASTSGASTQSFKCDIITNDVLRVRYTTVICYDSSVTLNMQRERAVNESIRMTDSFMKNAKSQFNELTGERISFKELKSTDGLEATSMSVSTPRKTAYYRRETFFTF